VKELRINIKELYTSQKQPFDESLPFNIRYGVLIKRSFIAEFEIKINRNGECSSLQT